MSAYQLAITIGIFLAYLIDGWLSKSDAWRWMLGASAIPGLLLFAVALIAPESPRWLMKIGRRTDASAQLEKIRPSVNSKSCLDTIEEALRQEGSHASWGEVFSKKWRRPLLTGLGLAVFQQITGINAVIYYADQIFAAAGLLLNLHRRRSPPGNRRVNVLATFGAAFEFIKAGGAGPASASPSVAGIVTLVAVVTFITCFAFSMASTRHARSSGRRSCWPPTAGSGTRRSRVPSRSAAPRCIGPSGASWRATWKPL